MVYNRSVVFMETPVFEEDIRQLMSDEAYAELKSSGVRAIYYWRTAENQILMLLVYKKAKQEDLTPAQKRALKAVVENWDG